MNESNPFAVVCIPAYNKERAITGVVIKALRHVDRVVDLANWIDELTGSRAGILYEPRRDWDKAIRRRASIEKARRILGYEPKTRMDEGLSAAYRWFKENWENIKKSANF
jgi:UDP-glucose 4-epimerase